MSNASKEKKPFQLFNLPWPVFLIITLVVFGATYLGVLPKGMAGCFIFMIVLGTILGWIGDHTPIIKSYLGGGAIVCIFGSALLVYFGILPAAKTVDGQTVYNMTLPFGSGRKYRNLLQNRGRLPRLVYCSADHRFHPGYEPEAAD